MRDREEWIREKEISPEGKNAQKEWKRKNIIFRLGVIVVILSVLAFCFLPTCIYRYGMYQMEQGKYSEAADTLNGLAIRMISFRNRRFHGRTYKECLQIARECRYKSGLALMEQEDYEEALNEFKLAGDYLDSADLAQKCEELIQGD